MRGPTLFTSAPGPVIAQQLLGMTLSVRGADRNEAAGMIVETEYYGPDDPASHSFRGQTARNSSMFAAPGTVYVYRSYGIHWCLNVVTGEVGVGAAILIRAVEPLRGIELMRNRRGGITDDRLIASGPGRLAQAFAIDRSFDRLPIGTTLAESDVAIAGESCDAQTILATRRIGVSRGATLFRRYACADSRYLSRRV